MATLYEYYNTGDDSYYHNYSIFWSAQTFTPSTAHKITSVKLKLYRSGLPGTLTIGIRATLDGHPTGPDLCSGTIDGNTLTEAEAGAWYEITFATGCVLSPDTKYAIVFRAPDGNSTNRATWKLDYANATYDGGNREYSGDSGSSWDSSAGDDFMFEEWGEPVSQVTYYFNARHATEVWTNPDNAVDNNLETYASTTVNGQVQRLITNTCPGDDLGVIAKVEIRAYGYGDVDDQLIIRPEFTGGAGGNHAYVPGLAAGWGAYQDITSDANAPDWSLWSHIQDLDCDIQLTDVGKGNTMYVAKVEIRVTYTPYAAPTVTTQAVTLIARTTATGHGNITNTGGQNCSKRGVCWNTTGNPTVADSKSEETDSFGTGAFTRAMTGLVSGEHYYVKAYAYNSAGYGYGNEVEFDTWSPPVSDIDVGAEPIDRKGSSSPAQTIVDKNNPANASGTLHSIKIWATVNITGLIVGTFYLTNGATLKCRDSELIGNVEAGAERTFTELSITVVEGDYIGCYVTTGEVERDAVGYAGMWAKPGEYIDPGDEATYDFSTNNAISLYGYGDFAVGWTNIAKVNGVLAAAFAKMNGVAVADIAKVNGVAV